MNTHNKANNQTQTKQRNTQQINTQNNTTNVTNKTHKQTKQISKQNINKQD